jgi:hypothetical protein
MAWRGWLTCIGCVVLVGGGACKADDGNGTTNGDTTTDDTVAPTTTTDGETTVGPETTEGGTTDAETTLAETTDAETTAGPTCEPSPGVPLGILFDGAGPGPDGLPEIDALPCDVTVGAGPLDLVLDCMASDGPEQHMVSFTGDAGLPDPAALEGVAAVLDISSNPEDDPYEFFTLTSPEGELLLAFESGSERVSPPAAAAGLGVELVDRGCEFEACAKRTALAFSYGDDTVELFDGEAGTLGDAFGVVLARAQVGMVVVDDPCFDLYRYIVVAQ